ncbi:DNA cytosine methyltransferase [Opitutus sp. ER46]|uniref:DNA cytosine methyltransferase n=1 Tax=Opitutus sp. ER46 TaxID=2161864 RepID=UPI000D30C9D8|nr:DNA cytosine methyltransferase [Opitutus sp. ER46]PTX92320.1 DNA cytosine methyltransferase [Opitutus sp. ER46]
MKRPSCIDLFCGCGGFSLGFKRAGFDVLAAIDFNSEAVDVFRKNFSEVPHVLHKDLTRFGPDELSRQIGATTVDVIIGGPPCQGFSTSRQRDGANSGPRMIEDPRRYLYREFLKYVAFFRPKVFVMENVLGIKSAAGGRYFTRVQQEARAHGYRVHPQVEKAFDLGVPQKRVRQLIIGTRIDLADYFPSRLQRAPRACTNPTLGEAIGDLPPLRAGAGTEISTYDMRRRVAHVARYGRQYLFETLEVHLAENLTGHRSRPHSDRDLRDFARLREGEHCAEAMKRGIEFEFPYDRGTFKDRYTRQHRNEPCSTIVAHLSKDGLMFIHPTQNRSLTPREAARVQSFPDWFEFPVARTHQFRLIGNAVPPLIGEALGLTAKAYIEGVNIKSKLIQFPGKRIPASLEEAVSRIMEVVVAASNRSIGALGTEAFKRAWCAVAYVYPGLHPNSALEHGTDISNTVDEVPSILHIEPRLMTPYYVQSGWPVLLEPVVTEAWRRYHAGELKDDEFYCSEATQAGLKYRKQA